MKRIRTAIIGLGNIGLNYDSKLNKNNFILTHANAVSSHKHYKLVAGLDKNLSQNSKFQNLYNVSAYKDIDKMLSENQVDLIILAVPSQHLERLFKKILKVKNVKFILCEKPFSYSFHSAKKLLKMSKENNINIVVNYFRRFHPNLIKLRNEINKNKYGKCKKCIVEYSKGINAYGSHLLVAYLFLWGCSACREI